MSFASFLSRVLWGRRREVTIVPKAPEVVILRKTAAPRTIVIKPAPRRVVVKETIVRKKR